MNYDRTINTVNLIGIVVTLSRSLAAYLYVSLSRLITMTQYPLKKCSVQVQFYKGDINIWCYRWFLPLS